MKVGRLDTTVVYLKAPPVICTKRTEVRYPSYLPVLQDLHQTDLQQKQLEAFSNVQQYFSDLRSSMMNPRTASTIRKGGVR